MRKNPKLNVGLVFDDSLDSTDGVAQYVKTLGAWLSNQGHNVSYLVGETKLKQWSGAPVYSLAKNQTVHFNGNRLTIPLAADKDRIKQVIKNGRFDVLHVMTPYSPFMAAKVIDLAEANTAVVGTFHIFPANKLSVWGSHLLRLISHRSLKRFNHFVSVSPPAAGFAKSAYHIESDVVPNPVDIKAFSAPRKKTDESDSRIVFLGRLVKRKGAAQLIDAFKLVSQQNPSATLTIAGDGPERVNLQSKAESMGLSQRIKFLGYVAEDQKSALLGDATVACFPSLYGESFGIVLVEAMAAGAGVVIGGNNPGYASVLGDQQDLLFDPRAADSFAGLLIKLLNDKNLRSALHIKQQKNILKYDIGVVGSKVMDMYLEAIARLDKNGHNKSYE